MNRALIYCPKRSKPQMFCSALLRFHVTVHLFFFSTTPSLKVLQVLLFTVWNSVDCTRSWKQSRAAPAELSDMRLGLVCFLSFVWLSECAPPTCYSRALGLSKEIMDLLDKIHTLNRTKTCAEFLPTIFLDVHNSCVTTKLRDFLYLLLNHPHQHCRERPRMVLLKRKVQNLHTIITRICYRDLVFFTNDCEAIDTGHSRPHYAEDRLQLLQEER